MNDFREQLIDRMIRIYGYENEIVIDFARLCESNALEENLLETLVKAHEAYPIFEDED